MREILRWQSKNTPNQQIHLTVKSVTFFAKAKKQPLFTSSDLVVMGLNQSEVNYEFGRKVKK